MIERLNLHAEESTFKPSGDTQTVQRRAARIADELLQLLQKNDHPILLPEDFDPLVEPQWTIVKVRGPLPVQSEGDTQQTRLQAHADLHQHELRRRCA